MIDEIQSPNLKAALTLCRELLLDELKIRGAEERMFEKKLRLYNIWHALPPEERYQYAQEAARAVVEISEVVPIPLEPGGWVR